MVSVQGVQGPSVVSHVPASLGSICWALTLHTKPTSRNNRNTYPFILALLSRGVSITTGTEAYMRWYNDCLSRVPGDWYARFCGEGVIAISSPYPTSYKMQVVVRCERVPPLYLCTPERQSLCESHRRRRWLTCG